MCSVSTTTLIFLLNVSLPVPVPTVATLCVKPCMARLTQGDEVLCIVRTTFRQRFDVMYFLNGNVDPVVKALLTERVRLCVLLADTLPFRSVASFRFGLSVVAFVTLVLGSLVLLAVSSVSQFRAAGVSTWFLWSSGH